MSNREDWRRAEEFMEELENDPEYRARRDRRREKSRRREEKYRELDRPILASLRMLGFPADSLEDVIKRYAPLPKEVAKVLIEQLESCNDPRQCEAIVRALGASAQPFDGGVLVNLYDSTSDESLKFAILNTISLVRPRAIDDWIGLKMTNPVIRKRLLNLGLRTREDT